MHVLSRHMPARAMAGGLYLHEGRNDFCRAYVCKIKTAEHYHIRTFPPAYYRHSYARARAERPGRKAGVRQRVQSSPKSHIAASERLEKSVCLKRLDSPCHCLIHGLIHGENGSGICPSVETITRLSPSLRL